ncbi:glycerophosphodiester phosphodiesterase family protein [Euryarchaeota archaeon]|nr:glycerophosphodiester phosphodiesterase family protein [Euryarchaeota archaeon]|tara:strand:- start:534 stop:1109 length:576 start_codon:yes stop_codon:yes gene_type:complete
MGNSGHRLGASGTKLENTIQGLRDSIENLDQKKFKYWEFDIRESIDGVVFVFHDDIIDVNGEMREISKMSFLEIREAGKKLDILIPTFEEVVIELEERKEKVFVEIKEIFSDKARNEIINRISGLEGWKIMATPERFEKSFPKESRDLWRKEIQKAGIDLVRVGRHRVELFRASKSSLKWIMAKPKWLFGL